MSLGIGPVPCEQARPISLASLKETPVERVWNCHALTKTTSLKDLDMLTECFCSLSVLSQCSQYHLHFTKINVDSLSGFKQASLYD